MDQYLARQASFADTRLTREEHDPAAAGADGLERFQDARKFGFAPDENVLGQSGVHGMS
jgi:hypothetical protein